MFSAIKVVVFVVKNNLFIKNVRITLRFFYRMRVEFWFVIGQM